MVLAYSTLQLVHTAYSTVLHLRQLQVNPQHLKVTCNGDKPTGKFKKFHEYYIAIC